MLCKRQPIHIGCWHGLRYSVPLVKLTTTMATEDQPLRIISNESNMVTEIEAGENTHTGEHNTTAEKAKAAEQFAVTGSGTAERSNNEVAANDGALIETLDTALHNKPGIAEGSNPSGSDRADYYEARSYGKTDSEEELDTLNEK